MAAKDGGIQAMHKLMEMPWNISSKHREHSQEQDRHGSSLGSRSRCLCHACLSPTPWNQRWPDICAPAWLHPLASCPQPKFSLFCCPRGGLPKSGGFLHLLNGKPAQPDICAPSSYKIGRQHRLRIHCWVTKPLGPGCLATGSRQKLEPDCMSWGPLGSLGVERLPVCISTYVCIGNKTSMFISESQT